MNNLGRMIKEYRELYNLTQERVATIIKVSRQAISNWERGLSYPDIFALRDLANIFDIGMEKLMVNELHLGKVISEHISEHEHMYYLAVSCPNCSKRHELSETLDEHNQASLYRFACDCKDDSEFIFDTRPQNN